MKLSYIIGAVLVAVIMYLGYSLHVETQAHSQTKLDFTQYREQQAIAVNKKLEEYRAEENRWKQVTTNLDNDWRTRYAKLETTVADLRANDNRLRGDLATLAAAHRRAATEAQPLAAGTTATDAVDLLADLLGSQLEAETILAATLDRSYAAGQLCERQYEVTQ